MTGKEATENVMNVLESMAIPYMVVGSLSSNFYGVERSTKDADFVIALGEMPISQLAQQLDPSLKLDPQMTFETITGTTRFVIRCSGIPFTIEIFLLSDDLHDQERFRRRCQVHIKGRDIFLPTAEDVVVTKLRWLHLGKRNKDHDDVRNVIAVQGDQLDWDYIHHWCDLHGSRERLDEIRRSIPPL